MGFFSEQAEKILTLKNLQQFLSLCQISLAEQVERLILSLLRFSLVIVGFV